MPTGLYERKPCDACKSGNGCNQHKSGKDHYRWSGDNPSYGAMHLRLRKAVGSASKHPCTNCGQQAQHWAQIHDSEGLSPSDYRPMCRSCHVNYDSAKLSDDDVMKIRIAYATGDYTQQALADIYDVNQVHISRIIRRTTRANI